MDINTKKLAELFSEETGLYKKESEALLNTVIDLMTARLVHGDKIKLNRLGVFEAKTRDGHKYIDPRDNKTERFSTSKRVISFKSSHTIKNLINAPQTND